jgi:3'-phosphoadenosine 5'-phosphosulfate sulfotransferase (PAPS reductase)/FAD synthetase
LQEFLPMLLHQLPLLPQPDTEISLPPTIVRALEAQADLALSSSGGKDSQAQQRAVSRLHRARGWHGRIFAIHADLGRIEWYGTLDHIRRTCAADGLPLVVVQAQRGMVDEWQHRHDRILAANETKPFWSSAQARYCTDREKTVPINKALRSGDKPFWSSAQARYCTKHEKTQPIDKQLRQTSSLVVCAVGIRAQESVGRAKKPRYQVRSDITTARFQEPQWCKTAAEKEAWADQAVAEWLESRNRGEKVGRLALTWHPILDWSIEQVWAACGTSALEMAQRIEFYRAGDLITQVAG